VLKHRDALEYKLSLSVVARKVADFLAQIPDYYYFFLTLGTPLPREPKN